MKALKNWIKDRIKPNPEQHANELMISLMFNSDTQYQINTFEALKYMFEAELERKEKAAASQCRLINTYLPKKVNVNRIDINDPIFEQPIKN